MTVLYFSSTDGQRSGRNSHWYHTAASAQGKVDDQNKRAESMGIKSRYQLSETEQTPEIQSKDVKD